MKTCKNNTSSNIEREEFKELFQSIQNKKSKIFYFFDNVMSKM